MDDLKLDALDLKLEMLQNWVKKIGDTNKVGLLWVNERILVFENELKDLTSNMAKAANNQF